MHQKLSHLTEKEVSNLMRRYYETDEKVDQILSEFKISTTPSNLVKLFPPEVHKDKFCQYCEDIFLVSARKSRSSYASVPKPRCPQCGHTNEPNCRCSHCISAKAGRKKIIASMKREIIENDYNKALPDDLNPTPTAKDAVYLLALSRHSLSEDMETIDPFSTTNPRYSPTSELTIECITHLYTRGYVAISVTSNLDSFVFNEELTATTGYYPMKVVWSFLPGHSVEEKRDYLQSLENIADTGERATEWKTDSLKLWHLIAKYECLEYYDYQLKKRGFEIENFGDKTHAAFETLLRQYSIGQIFNLVWQAARDTNDFIISEGIPRYRGKNMFVGSVQRKGDKAKAEGWEVKNSRRDFNCPQSVLSSTLFDRFLGIGQKYLETVASIMD